MYTFYEKERERLELGFFYLFLIDLKIQVMYIIWSRDIYSTVWMPNKEINLELLWLNMLIRELSGAYEVGPAFQLSRPIHLSSADAATMQV